MTRRADMARLPDQREPSIRPALRPYKGLRSLAGSEPLLQIIGATDVLAVDEDLRKSVGAGQCPAGGPRWWFLTMALAHLGEKDKARSYYDQLVKELEEQESPRQAHLDYRAEAAELLGIAEEPDQTDSPGVSDEKKKPPTEDPEENPNGEVEQNENER